MICESLAAEIEMVGMDSVMIIKGERIDDTMYDLSRWGRSHSLGGGKFEIT